MAADDDTTALNAVLFAMIAAIAVEDAATAVIAVWDEATAAMSAYAVGSRPAAPTANLAVAMLELAMADIATLLAAIAVLAV